MIGDGVEAASQLIDVSSVGCCGLCGMAIEANTESLPLAH